MRRVRRGSRVHIKASRSIAVALTALSLALLPAVASAQVQPYQTNDYGGFRNVLPPGAKGSFNDTEFGQFQLGGTYPPHATDQLSMYEDLVYATPGLAANDVESYFKDA